MTTGLVWTICPLNPPTCCPDIEWRIKHKYDPAGRYIQVEITDACGVFHSFSGVARGTNCYYTPTKVACECDPPNSIDKHLWIKPMPGVDWGTPPACNQIVYSCGICP